MVAVKPSIDPFFHPKTSGCSGRAAAAAAVQLKLEELKFKSFFQFLYELMRALVQPAKANAI